MASAYGKKGRTAAHALNHRLVQTSWRALVVLAVAPLLVGCGGSGGGDTAVGAAQAKVDSAQKALDEANAEAAKASTAFCSASASYITALDRYGDILNQTAATVGDVKTGGGDLKRPGQDAASAGEAAVEAHRAVAHAEQELAAAQATLAAAQASATGGTATASAVTPSAATSTTAAASSETVARVQQAEADLETEQAGISDGTPLVQASKQFNSAAVALEMAWLQLFSEAGCLTDEQQQKAAKAVHDYTKALQEDLAKAGYYDGTLDGVYGPSTVAAVEALQKAHGLPVTGTMDKATEAALQTDLAAKGGVTAQAEVASTAALQQTLKLAGYWDGPVDGHWSPALTDALKKFQTELGVPATGAVDAATIGAFEKAIDKAAQTPTVTVTATSTATVTSTVTSASSPASPPP